MTAWRDVLTTVASGEHLTGDDAYWAMKSVLAGEANAAQMTALAVGLRITQASVEEMAGLVRAMLDTAPAIPIEDRQSLVDTCGTGGNDIRRASTFSVSTIASFVAAGAGVRVCKHGNRAASATCGSADTLEALGVNIELSPEGVARCVEEAGMGFVYARNAHAAMRHAAPVRAELAIPTIFNYLGPLSNPARPGRQVLGVSDPTMASTLLGVLHANGAVRAMVVHGDDGLDELTTTGRTAVLELHDGEVASYDVDPESVGLRTVSLDDLRCGDAAANAAMARRVLGGDAGPHRDIVVLNAAAVLQVADKVGDLAEGVALAQTVIDDGRAAAALDRLVATSQSAA